MVSTPYGLAHASLATEPHAARLPRAVTSFMRLTRTIRPTALGSKVAAL
jgi:hypothetical protein